MHALLTLDSDVFNLFDQYGRLKRKFGRHGAQKGSGVWGHELDYNSVLWIKHLDVSTTIETVEDRFLYARMLTTAVLEIARNQQSPFFALVSSPEDNRNVPSNISTLFCAMSNSFWHLQHFRRVGLSPFLAFTDDLGHPSRALIHDCKLPRERPWLAKFASQFSWMCRVRLFFINRSHAELERLLRDFPGVSRLPSWALADEKGNSILHYAVISGNVAMADYLLRAFPPLIEARDMFNRRPLDLLMETFDEEKIPSYGLGIKLPNWAYVVCVSLLSGIEIYQPIQLENIGVQTQSLPIIKAMNAEYMTTMTSTLRIIFHCTCGSCILGTISPRMSYQLLYHASKAAITWSTTAGASDSVAAILDYTLRLRTSFLFVHMHTTVEREWDSLRKAVEIIVNWFVRFFTAELLPRDGTMCSTILTQVPNATPEAAHYLKRDNLEQVVVSSILDKAMETDEWVGNGVIMDECGQDIRALPQCRNDSEYQLLYFRYLFYLQTIERKRRV
ncbi:Ankyrin repeat-containing domain protein [Beauveria brongniartii RCEF 3172]|uniref:Ankyrin repeat-containing domain protein n=1 Tax=Beauveria brongniartii RCEF 3172 TaxID=1081107 RepID=A0A166WVC0_9HYPO|nr:Ankyrin repeat-containing domain protein [Beauveria brongniartii RCEF 3172]